VSAVHRGLDLVALELEQLAQGFARLFFVLDYENHRMCRRRCHHELTVLDLSGRRYIGTGRARQHHREGGPVVDGRANVDPSAVSANHLIRDEQTEAETLRPFAAHRSAAVGLENVRNEVGWNG